MSSRLQIVWEPSQQMVHARTSSHRRREQAGASPGHQMSSWHCLQTSMQITAMTLQARIQVHFWHTCNMGMHLLPHGAAMAWLQGLYLISAVSCSSQCASSLDCFESTPLQTGRATACMDTALRLCPGAAPKTDLLMHGAMLHQYAEHWCTCCAQDNSSLHWRSASRRLEALQSPAWCLAKGQGALQQRATRHHGRHQSLPSKPLGAAAQSARASCRQHPP